MPPSMLSRPPRSITAQHLVRLLIRPVESPWIGPEVVVLLERDGPDLLDRFSATRVDGAEVEVPKTVVLGVEDRIEDQIPRPQDATPTIGRTLGRKAIRVPAVSR